MISYSALADGNPYILLRPVQGIEQMPQTLHRQLQRISLQIIAKQPGFDLLLAGKEIPESSLVPVFAVEGQVSKNNSRFSLEVRLLDIKSKKIVTKAAREDIREEDLIRLYQAALESLFIPDIKPEKVKEDEEKTTFDRIKNIKKKSIFTTSPNHETIDFKKRILALKRNADNAIAEIKEEDPSQDESSPKKEAEQIRSIASNNLPLIEKELDPVPRKEAPKFPAKHKLGLGFDMIFINSDYYINTTTSLHALSLNAQGHLPFSRNFAFSYEANYSKVVSSTIEAPSLYSLAPGMSWLHPQVILGAYVGYETSFFTSIDTPGGGLKPFSLNPLSAKIKAEFDFFAYTKWESEISYSQIINATSDFSPISEGSWSGSGFQISLSPNYHYKNWYGAIKFEQSTLISQGETTFSYNNTRVAFSIRRSL